MSDNELCFELRLALALGKTLSELRLFSYSDEYSLWIAFESLFGFPMQKLSDGVAITGSAFCRTMGSKIKAHELLPLYESSKPVSFTMGLEMLNIWSSIHNQTTK